MLSFAAEFPVDHSRSSADFLRAIQTWVTGSPHTCLTTQDFAELDGASEAHIQKGHEHLDVLQIVEPDQEVAAVRYAKQESDCEWVTAVGFSRYSEDSWVGIRVFRESAHPSVNLPPAKKPVLIRTLLHDLGGALDGALRVGGSPFRLSSTDIDLAARLIRGTSGCRLPIVYVSAGFNRGHLVDFDLLARDLAGMAHVVVEPNRAFSLRLKIDVSSENVYGGTVGLYSPDGAGRRSYFIGEHLRSRTDLTLAILEDVRAALINRRAFDRCTWAFAQELASHRAIQALRASGSRELDKFIETFDTELAAKAERLEEAEREIWRLRAELQISEARVPPGTASLLREGTEQDLYPGEVFGIVRDALVEESRRVPADSRRQHVLTALIEANQGEEDAAGAMRENLKRLLRGATGLGGKIRTGLEEMGFSITGDGKHHKLVFQGDDRYTFVLPKSGSDHRGGMNAATTIARLLF